MASSALIPNGSRTEGRQYTEQLRSSPGTWSRATRPRRSIRSPTGDAATRRRTSVGQRSVAADGQPALAEVAGHPLESVEQGLDPLPRLEAGEKEDGPVEPALGVAVPARIEPLEVYSVRKLADLPFAGQVKALASCRRGHEEQRRPPFLECRDRLAKAVDRRAGEPLGERVAQPDRGRRPVRHVRAEHQWNRGPRQEQAQSDIHGIELMRDVEAHVGLQTPEEGADPHRIAQSAPRMHVVAERMQCHLRAELVLQVDPFDRHVQPVTTGREAGNEAVGGQPVAVRQMVGEQDRRMNHEDGQGAGHRGQDMSGPHRRADL